MLDKLFAIITGVLLLAHPLANAADISGYPIGFCNGEMSERSSLKYSGKGVEVSAAIHIPATYAATVAGNRIESVRVAIASKMNLKSIKVWIRDSLDGDDISSGTLLKGEFVQGWNTVDLDSPFLIPSDPGNGFYIGYSYVQTNKAGAISSLGSPHDGALWINHDGSWTDMSADGTLCIEGMVFGDRLPKYNLSFLSASTDPYFIVSEGEISCVAKIRNLATLTVTGFDIEAKVRDSGSISTAHIDCNLPLGETGSYKFTISPDIVSDDPASVEIDFTITSVNGHQDEDMTDNSASAAFNILQRAFRRVVLAEEFTTEECPNCPAVGEYFNIILADPEFSDNMELVCHHSGYSPDWLTTPFDKEYCWFYNDGGRTYAPAVMLDRTTGNNSDTDSPVFFPKSLEDLQNDIKTMMLIPARVSVIPSATLSADGRQVVVNVAGERVRSDIFSDVRITVFLVEDGIPARKQSGVGGGYIHNHVNRAVNATWGTPVEWDGDNYSYDCTFVRDESWNTDNLKVVAFISGFDSGDPNKCSVENTGTCRPVTSSVSSVDSDTGKKIMEIHTISGMKAEKLTKGINIVVYDDFSTGKIIVR